MVHQCNGDGQNRKIAARKRKKEGEKCLELLSFHLKTFIEVHETGPYPKIQPASGVF